MRKLNRSGVILDPPPIVLFSLYIDGFLVLLSRLSARVMHIGLELGLACIVVFWPHLCFPISSASRVLGLVAGLLVPSAAARWTDREMDQ